MKRDPLTEVEIEYIRGNCLHKTDSFMSKHLKRDIRTIRKARRQLGITKTLGGRLEEINKKEQDIFSPPSTISASQNLSESQRGEFFKTKLTNTLYYASLKTQFTKEEIDFYLEEWASLCVQFEDIVATETRQIDEYIKAEIMGNRIGRNIQITESEIQGLQEEVEALRATKDMETDEDSQNRDFKLMSMLKAMAAQSAAMSNDYHRNVDLKNRLLDQLNGRRKDRVDQLKRSGTTVMGLISMFRDRTVKDQQGRHMELMRMAKDKKEAEWRSPIMFEDRTIDCILMDDKSQIIEKEIVKFSDLYCKTIIELKDKTNKNILLIENDTRRIQFFQDEFSTHNIFYASSHDKAIIELSANNFDVICFDYDIGMDKAGADIAKYIIEILKDDQLEKIKFLIHSMNKDGARKIKNILEQRVKPSMVEVFPFEDMLRVTIGAKDA